MKIDPKDYPSRTTALAIIEAMKNPAYRWQDVERVTGLGDNALYVADRCFMVFGFPELEAVAVSRWVAERSMRTPGTRATTAHHRNHHHEQQARRMIIGIRVYRH